MKLRFEEHKLCLQRRPWTRYLRLMWHHLLIESSLTVTVITRNTPGSDQDYLTPNAAWVIAHSWRVVYICLDSGHIWKHWGSQKQPPQLWRMGFVIPGSCPPGGMGESGDFLEDDTFFCYCWHSWCWTHFSWVSTGDSILRAPQTSSSHCMKLLRVIECSLHGPLRSVK